MRDATGQVTAATATWDVVSDPANPVEASSVAAPWLPSDLLISDDYIYLCYPDQQLGYLIDIYSIANPASPSLVCTSSCRENRSMRILGHYGYATGLSVMDLSNPCDIEDIGFAGVPFYNPAVAVAKNYAYAISLANPPEYEFLFVIQLW